MLNIQQFRDWAIIPALDAIGLNSVAAQELLLGTALQESGLRNLVQLENGPARGLFQMEPATHDDIWLNFLAYKPELSRKLENISAKQTPKELATNLLYAAAMCRIHYYRVSAPLPEAGDTNAQAAYWKTHYNTSKGKGTAAEYLDNWKAYAK